MGLGQLRGPSRWTGSPLHCPNQISIVAEGGAYVCDRGHRLGVMKKGRIIGNGLGFSFIADQRGGIFRTDDGHHASGPGCSDSEQASALLERKFLAIAINELGCMGALD